MPCSNPLFKSQAECEKFKAVWQMGGGKFKRTPGWEKKDKGKPGDPKEPKGRLNFGMGVLNPGGEPDAYLNYDPNTDSGIDILKNMSAASYTTNTGQGMGVDGFRGICLRVDLPSAENSVGSWLSQLFFGTEPEVLLSVKVRIPELHASLPEPFFKCKNEIRINNKVVDMHPTFIAISGDLSNDVPVPGDIVNVDFGDRKNMKEPKYKGRILSNPVMFSVEKSPRKNLGGGGGGGKLNRSTQPPNKPKPKPTVPPTPQPPAQRGHAAPILNLPPTGTKPCKRAGRREKGDFAGFIKYLCQLQAEIKKCRGVTIPIPLLRAYASKESSRPRGDNQVIRFEGHHFFNYLAMKKYKHEGHPELGPVLDPALKPPNMGSIRYDRRYDARYRIMKDSGDGSLPYGDLNHRKNIRGAKMRKDKDGIPRLRGGDIIDRRRNTTNHIAFHKAFKYDKEVAIRSSSFGKGQFMGKNLLALPYINGDPDKALYYWMNDTEKVNLDGMVYWWCRKLRKPRLQKAVQNPQEEYRGPGCKTGECGNQRASSGDAWSVMGFYYNGKASYGLELKQYYDKYAQQDCKCKG